MTKPLTMTSVEVRKIVEAELEKLLGEQIPKEVDIGLTTKQAVRKFSVDESETNFHLVASGVTLVVPKEDCDATWLKRAASLIFDFWKQVYGLA